MVIVAVLGVVRCDDPRRRLHEHLVREPLCGHLRNPHGHQALSPSDQRAHAACPFMLSHLVNRLIHVRRNKEFKCTLYHSVSASKTETTFRYTVVDIYKSRDSGSERLRHMHGA